MTRLELAASTTPKFKFEGVHRWLSPKAEGLSQPSIIFRIGDGLFCFGIGDGLFCFRIGDGLFCFGIGDGLFCFRIGDGLFCFRIGDGLLCFRISDCLFCASDDFVIKLYVGGKFGCVIFCECFELVLDGFEARFYRVEGVGDIRFG